MKPSVTKLLASRGLAVPEADREPLDAYWARMRSLRARADETLLADDEIAVTVDARGAPGE